jgi:hypothetical protein
MDAHDWMLTVTEDNCPGWCSADHSGEDPQHDSVFHESAPITLELPSLVNADRFRVAFTTVCSEDYQTRDEGRRPVRVDVGAESESTGAVHEYGPIPSVEALDQLIADLRHAADALEQWRGRLPSAV